MANNLKKFADNAEYTAATLVYPAVSLIATDGNVFFDQLVVPAKYNVIYTGGTSYSAACDSNTFLSGETIPQYGRVETLFVGDCVTKLVNFNADYGWSKVKTVEVGTGLTNINSYAFYGCPKLESVTIHSTSMIGIGGSSFSDCSNLESFTLYNTTPPSLYGDPFSGTKIASGNGYIYVPAANLDAYKTASMWSNYSSSIVAIP